MTFSSSNLLGYFIDEMKKVMPTLSSDRVINPTPVIDLTEFIIEFARREYKINVDNPKVKILGKLECVLPGGSIKTRPAFSIIKDAVERGYLRNDSIIFEATSGNFGISLSLLSEYGVKVVTLVSRMLQEGVLEELIRSGVKIIELDVDICPAPGLKVSVDELTAKLSFEKIKVALSEIGLDTKKLEQHRKELEELLIKQDVINLAKFLAKIYDGFCPEQYDNELNPKIHEEITAREIEQQIRENGFNPEEFTIVCTFGTGGTATGLSRYFLKKYNKKLVRVVFPLPGQDVAGIRTKDKAIGLRFYIPELYLGEHEIDFEEAKRMLLFLNEKGINIGESSALALCAVIQMINSNLGEKFFVILPDGFEKYAKKYQKAKLNVNIQEAKEKIHEYEAIFWTHPTLAINEKAVELISSYFGFPKEKIQIANREEMVSLLLKGEIPDRLKSKKNLLLLCVGGITSLKIAQMLHRNGIEAKSIEGGLFEIVKNVNAKLEEFLSLLRN